MVRKDWTKTKLKTSTGNTESRSSVSDDWDISFKGLDGSFPLQLLIHIARWLLCSLYAAPYGKGLIAEIASVVWTQDAAQASSPQLRAMSSLIVFPWGSDSASQPDCSRSPEQSSGRFRRTLLSETGMCPQTCKCA